MDWFSWLSKTSLDPSLAYEYGLEFARNELQANDLAYFDHEFLKSMGIQVAKHRLEILKVARKEAGAAGPLGLSKLVSAISRSKRSLKRCIAKMVSRQDSATIKALPEPERQRGQWNSTTDQTMTKKYCSSNKELVKVEQNPPKVLAVRRQAKSGPLDRNGAEKMMLTNRSLKLSGPLDGKAQERLVLAYRSPKVQGTPDLRGSTKPRLMVSAKSPQVGRPWDERYASPRKGSDYSKERVLNSELDDQSLWSALFQDLKPT